MKKQIIPKAFSIALLIILMSSCVKTDDFEIPVSTTPEFLFDGQLTSIRAVKNHYNFTTNEIYTFQGTDVYMPGYVISSDEGGNFYKKLILQDNPSNPTAGIQILIDETAYFNTYPFGNKIYIKLDGLSLWYNNGVLQLGVQNRGNVLAIPRPIIGNHIIRSPEVVEIHPLLIDINNFNEQHKNLFIKLEQVQFNKNLIRDIEPFTFAAETIDQFDGERQLESCKTGATTILSTSTFADFKSLKLPQSSGSVVGVLTRNFYDNFYIIVLNNPDGINFNQQSRCDPSYLECGEAIIEEGNEIIFSEGFETITTVNMLNTRRWTNINVSGGSKRFEPGTFGGNRYFRISAFNTSESPLEAWLVTPPINLDDTFGEVLSADIRASYDNSTILSVHVSTDFTGNPLTATWTLLDANIPIGPSNRYGTNYKRSKIDISCLSGEVHIAFKYMGAAPDKTTTYDIDNVRVTGFK